MMQFLRSLKHASAGLHSVALREQSFRLQILASIVVLAAIIFLDLAIWQKILLILLICAVLVLEVINSIFERISDALKPRLSPVVKEIKDMMAGAVLLTAITSVIVALMIFWPYLQSTSYFLQASF
jgi:diacylglycerol kinase